LLLQDEELRSRLAFEQAAYDEAQRLDILVPAVQQAAAPLAEYRQWKIDPSAGESRVNCQFDVAGMRADPRIPSMVVQLYRNETNHRAFRLRELTAVRATRERLNQLLRRSA
jgi:hypothetical protein